MTPPPDISLAYRVAVLADRGDPEADIVRETGAPPEHVRHITAQARQAHREPEKPSAAEIVVLHYMTQRIGQGHYPAAQDIAQACSISRKETAAHLQSLSDKGLIAPKRTDAPTLMANDPEQFPPGTPRAAAMLIRQACEGGYIMGQDETRDAQAVLAAQIVDPGTTLIRVDAEATQSIIDGMENPGQPPSTGWPSSNVTYIEFEPPVSYAGNEDAMEGVLIGPPGEPGDRPMIIMLSRNDQISDHAFFFNPSTGVPQPLGPQASQPDDAENLIGRLVSRILGHVTGPDHHLIPASPSRPRFNWLVVNPNR